MKELHFQFPILHYRSGGHEGTRTPNFLLVREAVYQLTYVPLKTFIITLHPTRAQTSCQKISLPSKKKRIPMLRKMLVDCQPTRLPIYVSRHRYQVIDSVDIVDFRWLTISYSHVFFNRERNHSFQADRNLLSPGMCTRALLVVRV